ARLSPCAVCTVSACPTIRRVPDRTDPVIGRTPRTPPTRSMLSETRLVASPANRASSAGSSSVNSAWTRQVPMSGRHVGEQVLGACRMFEQPLLGHVPHEDLEAFPVLREAVRPGVVAE